MLQHTLICGMTGAGKSHLERRIIQSLVDAGQSQLILIDPKRVELKRWKADAVGYARNVQEMDDQIVHAYDSMMTRFADMDRRDLEEYDGLPLYVFVDEMQFLTQEKALKDAVARLGKIAFMGRSARVFVVLCTQLPTRAGVPANIVANMVNKVCLRLDIQGRAKYFFGDGYGYEVLPPHGAGYVMTPETLTGPRRATEDEIMELLHV